MSLGNDGQCDQKQESGRGFTAPGNLEAFFCHLLLWFFTRQARPVRFLCIGGITGLLQLALLNMWLRWGWGELPANSVAFLLSAQVNFALSHLFTWRDRSISSGEAPTLLKRWIMFHGSIAGTALLDLLLFTLSSRYLPAFLASALGICGAAWINFMVMNRVVFRAQQESISIECKGNQQRFTLLQEECKEKRI
ncbi:GtrA family protein [Ktedonosporobacter rubrisoli]|nr:GtrA family protein [Ktedonosporobacter rubrisoli]